MKLYIILTYDIHCVGGTQLYTNAKVNYLRSEGWNVIVLFPGSNSGSSEIAGLTEYIKYGLYILGVTPLCLSDFEFKKVENKISGFFGKEKYDKILIESHYDIAALWGEVLSERYEAKHICFLCNELFHTKDKFYDKYIDFFKFKYDNMQLLQNRNGVFKVLFDGQYPNEIWNEELTFKALEGEPVQDIPDKKIEAIERKKYNIAYIGRMTKGYVNNVYEGVCKFAERHSDDEIQFLIIGDYSSKKLMIETMLSRCQNLNIVTLGSLVPIPRIIYDKVDVVVAGSGCALISAEHKPTIVADCDNYMANGVLGYNCFNIFHETNEEKQLPFEEAIENVLINKVHLNYEFKNVFTHDSTQEFEKQMKFYAHSNNTSYYKFTKIKSFNVKKIIYIYMNNLYDKVKHFLGRM